MTAAIRERQQRLHRQLAACMHAAPSEETVTPGTGSAAAPPPNQECPANLARSSQGGHDPGATAPLPHRSHGPAPALPSTPSSRPGTMRDPEEMHRRVAMATPGAPIQEPGPPQQRDPVLPVPRSFPHGPRTPTLGTPRQPHPTTGAAASSQGPEHWESWAAGPLFGPDSPWSRAWDMPAVPDPADVLPSFPAQVRDQLQRQPPSPWRTAHHATSTGHRNRRQPAQQEGAMPATHTAPPGQTPPNPPLSPSLTHRASPPNNQPQRKGAPHPRKATREWTQPQHGRRAPGAVPGKQGREGRLNREPQREDTKQGKKTTHGTATNTASGTASQAMEARGPEGWQKVGSGGTRDTAKPQTHQAPGPGMIPGATGVPCTSAEPREKVKALGRTTARARGTTTTPPPPTPTRLSTR